MPSMPKPFRPPHLQQAARHADRQRGTAHQRGYTALWQKARLVYLNEHPLCVQCQKEGKVTAATVVDHVVPHKGDQALFWDAGNWQSLCARCHNRATALYDGGWGRKVKPKPGEESK